MHGHVDARLRFGEGRRREEKELCSISDMGISRKT